MRLRRPGDSAQDNPADPHFRSASAARLEAALFLADGPLTLRKLTEASGLKDATETRGMLAQLREHLQSSQSAFRIEEIAEGFQFLTAPECRAWLGRLRPPGHMPRLTPALAETLTVIAYKQPLTRADLDAVRGVDCGEALRSLMEKGLVRAAGRQDSLGRPQLYGTSKLFLQIYGLKSLGDLPKMES